MRSTLLTLMGCLLATLLSAQVRIVKVEPSTNSITFKNFGSSAIDISDYRLCALIRYTSDLTTGITISSGSLNLAANEEVVIVAPGGASSSWQDLPSNSDLGLYLPSGSFGSSSSMVDFVQWGSGGNGRESVAVTKGIWTAGTFVNGSEPYTYTGDGSQNGVDFWSGANNAPTDISLSSSTIEEDKPVGTVVGTFSTTDADTGEEHSYTLVAGEGDADNASFQVDGNELKSNEVFDFDTKSSYAIRVQTDDGNGGTFAEAFTISISKPNNPPTDIILSNSKIPEAEDSGTTVGTLSTTDADSDDTHTYSLVSGSGDDDNGAFQISNASLLSAEVFDFDTKSTYAIRIQTDDGNGGTFSKVFTIEVTEVANSAPTDITLSSDQIQEGLDSGSKVGDFTTTDENSGNSHSYSLVSGDGDDDNASFQISNASLLSAEVFDAAVKDTNAIRVQTDDGNGGTFSKAFTITVVSDDNNSPTAISLSATSVMEEQPANSFVGTLTTTDEDTDDVHTYSLVEGEGDVDNASFTISNDSLKAKVILDFETKKTYEIRIKTTDKQGAAFSQGFTISVTDINDPPHAISLDGTAPEENQDPGITIGTLTAADEDASDTHIFSLVQGAGDVNNEAFEIVSDQLTSKISFDFEAQQCYSIRVQVKDDRDGVFSTLILIEVADVNEAPTAIDLGERSISENQPSGTPIATLSAQDQDINDTHVFSFINGEGDTDNGRFSIEGASLLSAESFDFESQDQLTIRINGTDAGGLTFASSRTINVTDINDAPTDIALDLIEMRSDAKSSQAVAILSTIDQDGDDSHTYALVEGPGDLNNDLFAFSNDTLLTAVDLNNETPATVLIRISSEDGAGAIVEKQLELEVEQILGFKERPDIHPYPNPFVNDLTVPMIHGDTNVRFELYAMNGMKIFSRNVKPARTPLELKTDDLPAGFYCYHLIIGQKIIASGKLIKK